MKTLITLGIFIVLLPFTANAATEQEYLDWFNKNVALGHAYDPSVVKAYSDDAEIHIVHSSSDGIKQTTEMDGAKWKEMQLDVIDLAKQAGDKSEFSDIWVSVNGNQAKISANRYSLLDCFKDDNYYMIAEEKSKGNIQIIEESLESSMEPQCENMPENYLDYVLQLTARLINKQLPTKIDSYAELETVLSERKTLMHQYNIMNNVISELDPEMMKQKIKPMLTQQTCMTPNIRPLVKQGATMTHIYYGNEGNELFSVDVKESDCL
jgi:hypothetical protein